MNAVLKTHRFIAQAALFSLVLSGCASAPQPPASQAETKPDSTQCATKTTQDEPRKVMYIGGGPSLPAHYPTAAERKATMDALRMNICDAKTRLASVILRARTEGVPLDYLNCAKSLGLQAGDG